MGKLIFKLFYPVFIYEDKNSVAQYIWHFISLLLVMFLVLLLLLPVDAGSAISGLIYGVFFSIFRIVIFIILGYKQITDEEEALIIKGEDKKRAVSIWFIVWMAGITIFNWVNMPLFGFFFITIFTASNLVQLLPTRKKKKKKKN